ncbi:unnamed protein product [Cochlearia groenlandica]
MNTLCPKKTTLFKKSSKILSSNMMKARNDTFFKKAYELSTLCDVDVCVLHYGRDGDLIKTWPENQSKVRDMAERFAKLSNVEKAKKSTNLSQFLNKKITDDKKHDFDKLSEKLSAMESSLLRRLPLLQEKLRLLCPQGQISTDLSIVDVETTNKPCPVSTTDLSSSSMIADFQTCPVSTTNVSSSVTVVDNQTEALKNHMNKGHEDEMINTKENGNKYTVFVYDHEKRIFIELGNSSLPMLKQNNYTTIVYDHDKKTFTPLGGSAKTLMFVHVSPEAETLGETISTLKFAERVGSVELGAARVNKDNSEVKELKEQIANLKIALAKKGNGNDVQPSSLPLNRDRISRRRSLETPSIRPKFPTVGNTPSNLRPQIMDLSGPEAYSDTASSRRHSLDLHELMQSKSKDEDRESKPGQWIDKHEEELFQDENPKFVDKFYQTLTPQQQQSLLGGKQDFEVQSITDNESDETARSDSSDADLMWRLSVQVNVPRVSNTQSSANSKAKKVQPRTTAKLSETRSLIPSLIPAPSKRTPNSASSQPQRPTRDGKRRLSLGI